MRGLTLETSSKPGQPAQAPPPWAATLGAGASTGEWGTGGHESVCSTRSTLLLDVVAASHVWGHAVVDLSGKGEVKQTQGGGSAGVADP